MSRKKKPSTVSDVPKSLNFKFDGGPRDGQSIWLANPPQRFLRLAFPEWCTYEFDSASGIYRYYGTDPVPKELRNVWR